VYDQQRLRDHDNANDKLQSINDRQTKTRLTSNILERINNGVCPAKIIAPVLTVTHAVANIADCLFLTIK